MHARRTLRRIARLALAAFLFAQTALAIAACDLGERSAAQAIASAGAAGSEPCHQPEDVSTASLCVAHCVTQSQSLEKPFWQVPTAAPVPAASLLIAPARPWLHIAAADLGPPPAGPSRRILYRTFLI